MKLYKICDYVSERVAASTLSEYNYISTENMLPNKGGITKSSNIPSGNVIAYSNEDVLISNIRPYFKKIWQANIDGGCSADVLCVRAKETIYPRYLYYLLSQDSFFEYVMAGSKGCKMPRGDKQQIMQWDVKIPEIGEQIRIAEFLSSIDSKIELNRRINENLEQQAQALFKSWFVDFEPFKDGKFVDSELGMIPEGWRVGYYTELVDIKGGGTPKTNIKEFWNGSIPFFSPKDIGPSCFVLNTEKYITTNGLENCNSNLFPPYSVFITARGTVGKVVMVGSEMAMNQSNYALLGKQNISQFYVYLITLQLVSHLLKKANGAVFNAITTRDFASERIIIPFYSIIKSFSSIVKPIYENILLNEFQIKSLSQLRDTLLPRLMSGELEIKDNSYD